MNRKILSFLFLIGCLAGPAHLRAQQNATDDLIKSLQARVKRYPEDHAAYAALGAAYLQKGRETADAADYELAKGALEKSLDLVSNDPSAAFATTSGTIAQILSSFARPWVFILALNAGKNSGSSRASSRPFTISPG
jgi:tetratricopeptide (TPR) repeat protein